MCKWLKLCGCSRLCGFVVVLLLVCDVGVERLLW
jgi:hypothetical protein